MRILLVEDDVALASGLKRALKAEGYTVDHLSKGGQVEGLLNDGDIDAVILDLGLPDVDGLEVLTAIRKRKIRTPVLVLTARDSQTQKVDGLDAGADDYLTKPFDMMELFARLRVIERRLGTATSGIIHIGDVIMDTRGHSVTANGQGVKLANKEYMILRVLMENSGRVYSREKLESRLYEWGEEVSSNAVEVHIHHLRKKLPSGVIQTIRGVGYCITPQ